MSYNLPQKRIYQKEYEASSKLIQSKMQYDIYTHTYIMTVAYYRGFFKNKIKQQSHRKKHTDIRIRKKMKKNMQK